METFCTRWGTSWDRLSQKKKTLPRGTRFQKATWLKKSGLPKDTVSRMQAVSGRPAACMSMQAAHEYAGRGLHIGLHKNGLHMQAAACTPSDKPGPLAVFRTGLREDGRPLLVAYADGRRCCPVRASAVVEDDVSGRVSRRFAAQLVAFVFVHCGDNFHLPFKLDHAKFMLDGVHGETVLNGVELC